ncbi:MULTISPECIES: aldehyde ferredoxin oxidoreductase C-terminal domain-containing protein [unclassified Pseudodesulfovibrio]|uniref:aldehyde ferredoxin oxidoreductase family protein n=1 Tax=unclassified Pseudodesulfovibrio TaxID=2661612 RepID=UPI000FEBDA2D|nr:MULTISPECIES: aldehyde ferredoxin oxidoreductase C-terminal domain-containing protein [unclassified Pseudodesulfovibrio]MCJ2165039.1 aldehyde ferredoxin oxidoreductase [Pseudodesulfovibrio sp. S3-i]RWU03520.1 aldehyde ferredoxin oxidoreductase [Pseudodesulfovibrio sp. S3]
MNERFGWTGSVLHINLTSGTISHEHPHTALYDKYLGGKGLAGHYLRPHAAREYTDPLLPLLIFTGPLTGTIAPTSGRGTIMSRSPLTGTICDASVGGRLPTQLKRAGYDGLVITGQSDFPCGIEIRDSDVRLVETGLWGETTDTVFTKLETMNPKGVSIACIGPAAENGSRMASIAVDRRHAAGRGGLGLVCAAKNLKYLTVMGTGNIRVHNQAALTEAREEILRLTAASPVLMGQHGFSRWGTGALFDLIDARRMMPTDNFTKTRFEDTPRINAAAYNHRFSPRSHGCMGCHILCRKIAEDGRNMPGFETMSHFTALIGNTDMELVLAANDLCGRLGLDPVSAGSTLACYREITGQDFTPHSLLNALHEMAQGGDLGQGSSTFAQTCGHPEASMTVKGMELPAYDPRGAYGMALAYAVSTRGGCHLRAYPISHEILRKPVATDRFSFSGKARIIKIAEDMNAVVDSLTACKFTFLAAGLEEYAKAFTAVTGLETSGQALLEIGERIYYNERIMNAENGFSAEDDDLPERFFTEHGTSGGGVTIKPIDRQEFIQARENYYTVRRLDHNGRPIPEMIKKLGLEA